MGSHSSGLRLRFDARMRFASGLLHRQRERRPRKPGAEGEVMPASSMSATPDELFAELCKVTANWNRFDDIPDGQRAAVRSIGQKLHAIGGEAVMREAY